MGSIRAALAKHWRRGTATFLIALSLCVVLIWKRQARQDLVFAFSVRAISRAVRLPSSGINPDDIVNLLRLSLRERSLQGAVYHHDGTFSVTIESIRTDSTDQVERDLSTIYQQIVERLGKDMDPTPLSGQLNLLDARLYLIARTLKSTGLSAYERYALEEQALNLEVQRQEVRDQLDVVSSGFDPPTSQLKPSEQMGTGALLMLGLILSGFIACAVMILAGALSMDI